jgi:ribose transport system ATP-binding protein/rhamnose transport system ATP-binding protein
MNERNGAVATRVLLQVQSVEKSFGQTRALRDASLELKTGEVHALLGANGAGKSTLSKIVSGHVRADGGAIRFKDQPIDFRSARDAMRAGIAIVMQETSLAPDLSVLENIFLPELALPGRLSFGRLRGRADAILEELGEGGALPLDVVVSRLSAAQRQLVEIAKALASDAELIIFDEPTASLSPGEVERLFDIMARLRQSGRGLIFVSHRLEEVFAITDRVTILREGTTVAASVRTADLNQGDVIRLMVGRELGAIYAASATRHDGDATPVIFEVEGLEAAPAVRKVSFKVRRGEILGLAGLVGAGRSETAEAIFGLRPRQAGRLRLAGQDLAIRRPADAVRAGIGFVAEDRRVQSIVPDLSVRENLLLAHLGTHQGFGLGYAKRQKAVDALLEMLELPAHRVLDDSILNFSGGMQQKIIIARWLLLEPKVLILDEPTKGVDIGTRQAIYALLRRIAEQGVAIVVISSDFEELLGVSDRIVVISDGYSGADLPSAMLDEEKLTLLAAPRTSMRRNTELLHELATTSNGAGFWALLDDERLICLNAVIANQQAAPGFIAGEAMPFAQTEIPVGLTGAGGAFVPEPDGRRSTILVPIRNRRGHDFGCVGLVIDGTARAPSVESIKQRIEAMNV